MHQPPTSEIYTLSLHDALPICKILDYGKYKYQAQKKAAEARKKQKVVEIKEIKTTLDRKSTRLNSSHGYTSYAVFCMKKKTERTPVRINSSNCETETGPTASPI